MPGPSYNLCRRSGRWLKYLPLWTIWIWVLLIIPKISLKTLGKTLGIIEIQQIFTDWWFQPLWKIWKSTGMIIQTCSKPPTSSPCLFLCPTSQTTVRRSAELCRFLVRLKGKCLPAQAASKDERVRRANMFGAHGQRLQKTMDIHSFLWFIVISDNCCD